MIVKASFSYTCKLCTEVVILYLYEGLPNDSRMGNHWCAGMSEQSCIDPDFSPMDYLEEIKPGETVCIHGNNRPLECKQCRWSYGSGPGTLAGNEDL